MTLAIALVPRSVADLVTYDDAPRLLNLPNVVTVAGFFLTLGWLAGGGAWMGLAGLVADELDGRIARATGQTSEYGADLDWSADVVSSALILSRLGRPLAIPFMLAGQVYLREQDWRPSIGSARAVLTLYAMATGKIR